MCDLSNILNRFSEYFKFQNILNDFIYIIFI
mgnify:CR=1 FL=1